MALYGEVSLAANSVLQPVCLFDSKQTLGELHWVNIFASLIACDADAGGFYKESFSSWEYTFMALYAYGIIPLLILDPVVSLCSQQFLEAFSAQAHFIVFGMCISYTSCSPIMQTEMCIDSQQLVALYNRII